MGCMVPGSNPGSGCCGCLMALLLGLRVSRVHTVVNVTGDNAQTTTPYPYDSMLIPHINVDISRHYARWAQNCAWRPCG
jgi:hypothetical protein